MTCSKEGGLAPALSNLREFTRLTSLPFFGRPFCPASSCACALVVICLCGYLSTVEHIAAIVLAAGRSQRMGAFKPLLPFGAKTVIESLKSQSKGRIIEVD